MANKGRFKDMKVLSEEGWHAMHDKVTKRKMFGYEFLLFKLLIFLFFSFFAVWCQPSLARVGSICTRMAGWAGWGWAALCSSGTQSSELALPSCPASWTGQTWTIPGPRHFRCDQRLVVKWLRINLCLEGCHKMCRDEKGNIKYMLKSTKKLELGYRYFLFYLKQILERPASWTKLFSMMYGCIVMHCNKTRKRSVLYKIWPFLVS